MTSNDQQIDLVINRLKRAQYEELHQQGKIDETQLYMITDDPNVSSVVSSYLSEYYPKSETSSATEIRNAFDNIPKPDMSEYYKKTETSSAVEISSSFDELDHRINRKVYIDGIQADGVSAIHLGADEYYQRVIDDKILSNELYFLSSDYINAFGQQIKNVAAPELSDDAATKGYVDSQISAIPAPDLSDYYKKSETSSAIEISSQNDQLKQSLDEKICIDGISAGSLSVIHAAADDYYQRVIDGTVLSNELYILSSDHVNAYGQQIKNVAGPELSDDAATKGYVDAQISSIPKPDLTEYYKKSETSSASEISSILNYCAKVSVDNEHAQDLHLRHISYDDYAQLVVDENADPHTVYVLSGEGYDDQFGNRIANVAAPELSGDAANKAYVDGEISNLSANLPKAGSSLFLTDDSLQLSGMQSDANIVKVTHDKYKWYINNYTQQELSNYIFVLSSDVEDVFGKRIANVADPIQANDSANKKYVDESINEINQKIGQINSALDTINGEIA